MRTELYEQSKEAMIAYLKDDKMELEFRSIFVEDNWTPYSGNAFCLGLFYYRIAKPKRKYRVGTVGGNPCIVYDELPPIWVEGYFNI